MYKNFKQYSDKQDNCIDIEEYVIARKGEKPDESQKLIFSLRYEFFRENGQDALKVTGLYFIQATHQLDVEGFQAHSWDAEGAVWGVSQDGQHQQEIPSSWVGFCLNNHVPNSLIYSPLDDSRVKEIWGAYVLSLSELPTRDFSTQDDQVLLQACEDPGDFPTQDNQVLLRACDEAEVDCIDESDIELRAIAEAAEASEHLNTEF